MRKSVYIIQTRHRKPYGKWGTWRFFAAFPTKLEARSEACRTFGPWGYESFREVKPTNDMQVRVVPGTIYAKKKPD